ncbi:TVP38/TMEM64 family protein [Candidatus Uhrbacteria bacterium]|nr:TVP38/TMEM64 family protein [Candidatus Uhrbacteria bacterium]
MKSFDRAHWLKIGILAIYAVIVFGIYFFLYWQQIPLRTVPGIIASHVSNAGIFGPIVLLAFAASSSVIPFPTAGISVIAGVLYGPWLGALLAVVGINLAASISFLMSRYLGRHFVSENERGWVRAYDDLLSEQGFITVLGLRLLMLPFDFIGLAAGLTRMPFRQFVAASVLGSIPSTVSFVVLGESLSSPKTWGLFAVLFCLSLAIAFFIRRSNWGKKMILVEPKKSPEDFEKDV